MTSGWETIDWSFTTLWWNGIQIPGWNLTISSAVCFFLEIGIISQWICFHPKSSWWAWFFDILRVLWCMLQFCWQKQVSGGKLSILDPWNFELVSKRCHEIVIWVNGSYVELHQTETHEQIFDISSRLVLALILRWIKVCWSFWPEWSTRCVANNFRRVLGNHGTSFLPFHKPVGSHLCLSPKRNQLQEDNAQTSQHADEKNNENYTKAIDATWVWHWLSLAWHCITGLSLERMAKKLYHWKQSTFFWVFFPIFFANFLLLSLIL